MKSILCLLLLVGMSICSLSQPVWVTFTDPHPSAPIITLLSSSSQQVTYSLVIPGMYIEDLVVGPETYQRISIPKAGSWGDPGSPELSFLSKLIAVPGCDSIIVSYLVTDSIILDNYTVYPRPEIVYDSLSGTFVEQFIKYDSIYLLNRFMPEIDYEILSEGYLRNQRTANVAAYPIKCNPVTNQLVAYTRLEVTLSFQNAQGDVNVNNGLLSNLTNSTLLNYNLNNDKMPPYPVGTSGSVTWVTLNSKDDANTIVADYLIITDEPFFNPHSVALQALADHRARFNGFDVAIVNIDNILLLNYEYEPPSNPDWIEERQIRSFIKRVYDGQNAAHTYDGFLAFICLVGDAYADDNNDGVPTSYDPDPTCHPVVPDETWSPNDYYYTCVTQDATNNWDVFGEIFIGRLCVDDEDDLSNIVTKIKHNENEYTFENWRTNITLAYGSDISGNPIPDHEYFCVRLNDWVNTICESPYAVNLIDVWVTGTSNWKDEYINFINTPGSNIVLEYSHGWPQSWAHELSLGYKMANMTNNGKYPFVISQACFTGKFTANPGGDDCLGEEMLLYHPNNGYVAYLGSWKEAGGILTGLGLFPRSLQERILHAIFQNLSHVLGEAVLEARIGVLDPLVIPGFNPVHFQHNLFGDPALNLMAPGYEITQNTSLPPDPPFPQTTTISTKVYVRPGVTLSLDDGAVLEFSDNGQLIIENGAILELGNNVTIKGQIATNKIRIEGVICGPGGNINNPVPINNLILTSIPGTSWKGLEFCNPDLIVRLDGGSVNDCQLSGELNSLELTSSISYLNSKILLNQSGILIEGCNFTNTNILLTNNNESGVFAEILDSDFQNSSDDALIRIEHYPAYSIQNCTINYDHGTGIDLYYSGNKNGQYLIKNNILQNSGSPQDMSWGIKIYNSFADIETNYITNNRYGVACLNQSQVQLIGNPNASTNTQTQNIVNNNQNQVRATDNSFPFYFHYNIVQNSPPGSSYLVYYDPVFSDNPPVSSLFNIKCNCFDNPDPTPQLYPTNWYYWSIWCPPAFCQFDDPGIEDFETAVISMDAGDYTTAETQFKNVIKSYPGTPYCREAAKKMIPLKKLSDQDFSGLKLYYDTTSALHEDSLTDHLVYRLKNKCNVEMENYEVAISWFENDILNPVSIDDSVFSLIDLSDTYILMEADSNLESSLSNYTGGLTQYKPKNREEYTIRQKEWINLLFNGDILIPDDLQPGVSNETNMVQQNFPNPFSTSTEVSFTLSESSNVLIVTTNLLGQVVKILERPNQNKGTSSVTIDLSSNPDGIYFITIYVNQIEAGKIKAVKSK